MLLVSKGFKSALLGTQSFAQIFAGGEIRIFSGARPTSANRAQGNNLLGRVTRVGAGGPGLRFTLTDGNVIKTPSDAWRFLCDTAGSASWFRLVAAGDTGTDSNTAPRIDGDIGSTSSPSDMTLTTITFAVNDSLPIDGFLYTIPPL